MKKIIAMIMVLTMLMPMFSGVTYASSEITQAHIDEGLKICSQYPVKLALDGKEITFEAKDVPPVIVKERTLIPARALFEAMGGTVLWNNDTQTVNVKYDNTEVELNINSNEATVNGEKKQLEVPALIIDHDGDYYGSTMIPVRFTAEALGCAVGWDDPTRTVLITSPGTGNSGGIIPGDQNNNPGDSNTGDHNPGDSNIENNNPGEDDSNYYPGNNSGSTWQYEQLNEAAKSKIVAIDLGHGGKDSGSIGHEKQWDQLYEKDVNLQVGLKLKEYLQSAGVNTYMIRETDVYYTLLERAQKANDIGATVFVSIHNNSNENSKPSGTEVLYNSKVNAAGLTEMQLYGIESKTIANNVQKELVSALGTLDRGSKSSPGMAVLNKTTMPAIIVEGAFLSNESDFAKMKEKDYADKYALAVAKAIVKSLNEAYK